MRPPMFVHQEDDTTRIFRCVWNEAGESGVIVTSAVSAAGVGMVPGEILGRGTGPLETPAPAAESEGDAS